MTSPNRKEIFNQFRIAFRGETSPKKTATDQGKARNDWKPTIDQCLSLF
jgi:hypothetical protein